MMWESREYKEQICWLVSDSPDSIQREAEKQADKNKHFFIFSELLITFCQYFIMHFVHFVIIESNIFLVYHILSIS